MLIIMMCTHLLYPTVVLVNLEMTDKLRIVILLSIRVGAYNFGTVRDSLGAIPEPSGAPG
jgi:hypothetical protein